MRLRLGEVFLFGLRSETAVRLCEACARLGIDRTVIRTTDSGFIVPEAVADEYEKAQAPRWAEAGATL